MTERPQSGFSLIELVFFIVVVSVGLAGVLQVMQVTTQASADPLVRKQALALAESILQEALQKDYADPDPLVTTGESTRATFDDVDDFNGRDNTAFPDLPTGLSTYVIAIVVAPATLGTLAVKRVTVSVTRGRESISLSGYRSAY
ncbi:MAG: prepilin-type N-terminal cleavage/methylation domain-containing protein [Rhodoferax sp.]|nr:prepilin-type N-terminal cleavage/methylation domain-containing protein [Rhodoferax sp.]